MHDLTRASPAIILNVDDNEDARVTLSWLLRSHDYEVREASSGEEALRLMKTRPHLVVLDVVLPDQDGFEVCRRIKADPATAATPVLMLSGAAVSSDDRIQGLEGGADAYLTKPAEPAVIVAHVKALLRVRQAEEVQRRALVVLETTTDCFVVLDSDWRYTYVNSQAERILKRSRAELVGMSLWEAFPAAIGMLCERELRRAQAERSPADFEEYYPFLDAWLEVRAIPSDDGLSIFFRDVSGRRRAESALRLRDRAMQAVSQGILITDPARPDNPIIYASPGFERLTGYEAHEVLGRNCRFLQGPATDHEVVARMRKVIRAGEEFASEILNYRKDGEPFWNHIVITPIRDGERITHFVGVQVDVTERRRLEEQYRHAQKMEAVGQLAGGVAHDFNNLLTIVNGYGDILLDRLPADDPSRSLVAEMRQAGERAAKLTRQLLAFSRKAVVAPRIIAPGTVVQDVVRMIRPLIGENIELVVNTPTTLGLVRADAGQIEQVLLNLVVNARDAMPHGGRLTIETHDVRPGEGTEFPPTVPPGAYVSLFVRDTGVGMTPAVLGHLFEPFFTTKGPGKGTGLGLATVHGIVQQSGGYVVAESEVGRGTTFRVFLPRVEAAESPARAPAATAVPRRGDETILLVEDEEAVRSLARTVLSGAGYTVLEAGDGAQALRLSDAHRGRIDLLATDVVMPGLGGRMLAQELLTRRPGLRVLYLSGYTDDAIVRHGVEEAEVNFLGKPFGPDALTEKVRAVLDAAG